MPLYMDVHDKIDGLTAEAVAGAHKKDPEPGSGRDRTSQGTRARGRFDF
jgi:hypothetical protein